MIKVRKVIGFKVQADHALKTKTESSVIFSDTKNTKTQKVKQQQYSKGKIYFGKRLTVCVSQPATSQILLLASEVRRQSDSPRLLELQNALSQRCSRVVALFKVSHSPQEKHPMKSGLSLRLGLRLRQRLSSSLGGQKSD
ncbi:uncharacterized protein LOC108089309 [Drosophila ficusphila]|uniref:uncharacterized protein LOC108089309 n=1 Tax=Drosophila ficusphila TaxID=30025 RepID=UPI0007E77FE9|nr:uncharacterized protein LOC108089309 [Drosophila ficusphila]